MHARCWGISEEALTIIKLLFIAMKNIVLHTHLHGSVGVSAVVGVAVVVDVVCVNKVATEMNHNLHATYCDKPWIL